MAKYTSFALSALLSTAYGTGFPFSVKPAQTPVEMSGKQALMNNLVSKSRTIRELNDYQPDIHAYSLKFEKCQFMRQLSLEDCDEEAGTCLETKRFAIFKLCQSCDNCNYNYGEYMIDLEMYLEMTVAYYQEEQEQYCDLCQNYCGDWNENGNNNNNQNQNQDEEEEDGGRMMRRKLQYYNVDCDTCVSECYKIENMEENGYQDATDFLECQNIYEDNYGNAYFAGPMCSSNGEKIKIGVFKDENCGIAANVDADDYLKDGDGYQIKLSHNLLKKCYLDTCISCTAVDWDAQENGNNNNNNGEEEIEVTEACEQLYEEAAKCETEHGFDATYNFYDIYYNLAAMEDSICGMISQLKSGLFDSTGEITLSGKSSSNSAKAYQGSSTSGGQKFALTVLIIATVGLAVAAASLHSKLTKGGNADLSQQGGAMA